MRTSRTRPTRITARIPPQLTLDVFAGEYLGERLGGAALVERGEELLGLIGTAQIRRIPRRNWPAMRTEQAMVPLGSVPWARGDSDLWPALEVLERSGLDGLLIGTGEQVSALLTRRSISLLIRERATQQALASRALLQIARLPGRRPPTCAAGTAGSARCLRRGLRTRRIPPRTSPAIDERGEVRAR